MHNNDYYLDSVSKELQHQNVAVPVHNEAQYEAPVCISSSYQGVKMTHHDYSGKRSRPGKTY